MELLIKVIELDFILISLCDIKPDFLEKLDHGHFIRTRGIEYFLST